MRRSEAVTHARADMLQAVESEVLIAVRSALARMGDHAPVFVVGGTVRDLLLGREHSLDLDLAVEGDGPALAQALAAELGGSVTRHRGFGTATVAVERRGAQPLLIDIASCRRETYAAPGALPDVSPASIDDDLERRDVTINALALPLGHEGELLDPFRGRDDLASGTVRVLHDNSFIDDPTRIFRAARYAGRLGFSLSGHTLVLARAAVAGGALRTISPARLRNELVLMCEEPAAAAFTVLAELGIGGALAQGLSLGDPVIERVAKVDAMGGTPDEQSRRWLMRLAAIVLDMDGDEATAFLRSLTLPERDVKAIVATHHAYRHMSDLLDVIDGADPGQLHVLLTGHDLPAVESAASWLPDSARDDVERYLHERLHVQLVITGRDLIAMGTPRGPLVGMILEQLYEQKIAGEIVSYDDEVAQARALISELELRGERELLNG